MAEENGGVVLSMQDLRGVAGYAAESAREALGIFEGAHPADPRPRDTIDAARAFARCGEREKALRDAAWAAMLAASAAYLHPLADAHQLKHILGAAAHAAMAAELVARGDRDVGADCIERARWRATPVVVEVLGRYPAAPPGGGRVEELLRDLDGAFASRARNRRRARTREPIRAASPWIPTGSASDMTTARREE